MPKSNPFLDSLTPHIEEILEASRSQLTAILVGFVTNAGVQTSYATYQTSAVGKGRPQVTKIEPNDDILLFRQASLFKAYIAVAMAVVINMFPGLFDDGKKKNEPENPWLLSFSTTFNRISTRKIRTLPGDPSIAQLLVHFKACPNINDLLLAPDGSFLLSEEEFVHKTMPQLCESAQRKNDSGSDSEYSNGNYILIALLIEAASGKTLAQFLKEEVLEKLEMNHTYVTEEDFQKLSNPAHCQENHISIARPHIVHSDGTRRAIEIIHPKDTIELVVLGGYTTAADTEIFFRAVIEKLPKLFGNNFPHSLYSGKSKFQTDQDVGYKPLGLLVTLGSTWLGSHSLNRLISPSGDCSKQTLGRTPSGEDLEAYYLAGSATGTSNTVYFLPKRRLTVIVLTNTSGPVDASDLISRICLQKRFDLRPSEFLDPNEWIQETLPHFKKLEDEDSAPDTKTADYQRILGVYANEQTGQMLRVFDSKDLGRGNKSGLLRMTIYTAWKRSQPMRFVRLEKSKSLGSLRSDRAKQTFRICSLAQDKTPRDQDDTQTEVLPPWSVSTPGFGIDVWGCWKNLEFQFHENKEGVYFSRQRGSYLDRFVRVNEA